MTRFLRTLKFFLPPSLLTSSSLGLWIKGRLRGGAITSLRVPRLHTVQQILPLWLPQATAIHPPAISTPNLGGKLLLYNCNIEKKKKKRKKVSKRSSSLLPPKKRCVRKPFAAAYDQQCQPLAASRYTKQQHPPSNCQIAITSEATHRSQHTKSASRRRGAVGATGEKWVRAQRGANAFPDTANAAETQGWWRCDWELPVSYSCHKPRLLSYFGKHHQVCSQPKSKAQLLGQMGELGSVKNKFPLQIFWSDFLRYFRNLLGVCFQHTWQLFQLVEDFVI